MSINSFPIKKRIYCHLDLVNRDALDRRPSVRTGIWIGNGEELVSQHFHLLHRQFLTGAHGAATGKARYNTVGMRAALNSVMEDIVKYLQENFALTPILQTVGITSNEDALTTERLQVKTEPAKRVS